MKYGEKLDKKKAYIRSCSFSQIRHILEDYHYKKGAMGGGISICFAMFIEGDLVGGSVIGKPRHEKKYPGAIDIRRMACLDIAPRNSESFFLGQIIKYITCNTKYNFILSYSDKTVGHEGTIYKASNFKCVGETAPTTFVQWGEKQYHPRSLSIDRDYSYKMREAIKTGEAELITGKPKRIWIYEINKRLRTKVFKVLDISNQLELF